MKHFLIVLAFIPFIGKAQLAPLQYEKSDLTPRISPRALANQSDPADRSAEILLFEDFQSVSGPGLPNDWNGGEPVEMQEDNNQGIGLGTYVDPWVTGDAYEANNGGYFPVPHIENNRFAYANDDGFPCNCDMNDVYLTLPTFDFSEKDNMIITFDAYTQATFGGDNLSLEISIDGGNFITLFTAESSPEWQPIFVDLSIFDGQPEVLLRFHWSDNGYWSSGAAVDNVMVAENVAFNAGILRAHAAEYTAAWNDTEAISGEYSMIPYAQATQLTAGATVKNKGAQPIENVVLSVSIYSDGNFIAGYNSEIVDMMLPTEEEDIYVYTDFVPDQLAEYTISYELFAENDEDLSDNSAVRFFELSADVYALDDGVADSFRDNSGSSFTIGNYFEIPNEGSMAYSIGVAIGANSVAGTQIHARIYNSDFIFETGSEPYIISNEDVNEIGGEYFVNIPLQEPFPLEAGNDYIAAIAYFANPFWQFTVSNSGSSQEQFSVFQNEIGDWYYVTTTPMVRLNLSPTVGQQETASIETLKLVPNPVRDSYTLHWEGWKSGKTHISITDLQGREAGRTETGPLNGEALVTPINVAHLAPGIYQIRVHNGQGMATARFLKID